MMLTVSSLRPSVRITLLGHALPPLIHKVNRSTLYILEMLVGYLRPLRLYSLSLSTKTSTSILVQRCLLRPGVFVLLNHPLSIIIIPRLGSECATHSRHAVGPHQACDLP
jgi:hypothetical protein